MSRCAKTSDNSASTTPGPDAATCTPTLRAVSASACSATPASLEPLATPSPEHFASSAWYPAGSVSALPNTCAHIRKVVVTRKGGGCKGDASKVGREHGVCRKGGGLRRGHPGTVEDAAPKHKSVNANNETSSPCDGRRRDVVPRRFQKLVRIQGVGGVAVCQPYGAGDHLPLLSLLAKGVCHRHG